MQALIAGASVAAGGNALALDPGNGDRLWIDLGVSWLTNATDLIADAIMMFGQQPYQTYGDGSYARLKAIQKVVDPNGFFPKRTGGFKYT